MSFISRNLCEVYTTSTSRSSLQHLCLLQSILPQNDPVKYDPVRLPEFCVKLVSICINFVRYGFLELKEFWTDKFATKPRIHTDSVSIKCHQLVMHYPIMKFISFSQQSIKIECRSRIMNSNKIACNQMSNSINQVIKSINNSIRTMMLWLCFH